MADRRWPYSPGQTIESANDNADKEGLATGENDYDNNSIHVFRSETFGTYFAPGGAIWTKSSGRIGTMTAGAMYAKSNGDRTTISGVGSYTFTASMDTYVWIHETAGTRRYEAVAVGAAPAAPLSTEALNAVITTNATDIITVTQSGVSAGGYRIYNTSALPQSLAPLVRSVTSASTVTPSYDTQIFSVNALAENTTIAAPTGSGSVADGQAILIRIKDNGTARTLTWNATYKPIGITLPTATVANKMVYVLVRRNAINSTWDALSVGRES